MKSVGDTRQGPDDRVVVEEVHVVVPGPGAAGPDRFEGGNAGGEHRPDRLLEESVVDLEIGCRRIVLRRRRAAGDVEIALRTDIHAGRIDEERETGQRLAAGEGEDHPFPRRYGKLDAERREERRRAGAGGDDHSPGGDPRSVGEPDRGGAVSVPFDCRDLGRQYLDPQCARLAASACISA